MIDLDAIEARANAATPGPWWVDAGGPDESADLVGGDNSKIADLPFYAPHRHLGNEAFLCHAREDVPALIARIRTLEAALQAWQHAYRGVRSEDEAQTARIHADALTRAALNPTETGK